MIRRLSLRVSPAQRGQRLDELLEAWLPVALAQPLSKAKLRRLVMVGAILVEGRPLRRPGWPATAGSLVEARVKLDRLHGAPARDIPFALTGDAILYEDEALIAIDKPPGLPTQPTVDSRRPNLFGAVKRFLAGRRGAGGYLGLHQRLDRDTSGVVLFTKDPAANAGVAGLFSRRALVKTYHALTARPRRLPPPAWSVTSALAPVRRGRGARIASVRAGGVSAETRFERLETFPSGLLLAARPRTGRKHQIRVHLAEAGLPILGDDVYGSRDTPHGAPRLMLHAVSLEFGHPITGADIRIESPYPEDFARTLEALRNGPTHGEGRGRGHPR